MDLPLHIPTKKIKTKISKLLMNFAKKTKLSLKNYKPVEKYEFSLKNIGLTEKNVDKLINYILKIEYNAYYPTPENLGTFFINTYYDTQIAQNN
jgi:hypothetical protein